MTTYPSPHLEAHKSQRAGWLRAAVLGANDGIVSVSSIMLGVLAATQNSAIIFTSGIAGLVAGALSMAVGEYVSVASQKDSEMYDINIEYRSIAQNPEQELAELAWIYEQRGISHTLALQVAEELHQHDAVRAHVRDELGIDHDDLARPMQAAVASAIAFSVGAGIPIIAALVVGARAGLWSIVIASLIALAVSGAIGAYVGGGKKTRASLRVLIGGGIAMAITYGIGHLVGIAV